MRALIKEETMKRQRGRNRNKNNNHNNHNRAMDSNGPDVKVRGTASTIYEKYTTLARDAASSGNRVKAENYRQHAEHYLRLLNIQEAAKQAAMEEREAARAARGETDGADDEDGEKSNNRRNPRNNRRRHNKDAAAQDDENNTNDKSEPAELDVVTPEAESNTEESPTPKNRRKAPVRKKEPVSAVDETIDAAE